MSKLEVDTIDTKTGTNSLTIKQNDTAAITIDTSQNVGIGTTSPDYKFEIETADNAIANFKSTDANANIRFTDSNSTANGYAGIGAVGDDLTLIAGNDNRMRIDSSGNVIVGGTSASANGSSTFYPTGYWVSNGTTSTFTHASFQVNGSQKGYIQTVGETVTYAAFTGVHWSRLSNSSKPTILKGTILESLDEMMDWYRIEFDIIDEENNIQKKSTEYILQENQSVGDIITYNYDTGKQDNDGNNIIEEVQATIVKENIDKHCKAKVSDTIEAKNIYGVFSHWDEEDEYNDMLIAQTGTFVVRMNSAETVSKGDLIQSNGDGTGKVQSDDIIRASTVAKVLSTTKIETYEDGSYIVPCSLHC